MSEMKSERELATDRREDHLRALDEELQACKNAGKDERVKAIGTEISRVKKTTWKDYSGGASSSSSSSSSDSASS